ncbi:unnamed protein product [Sympodiomycopsis kandeliae]
MGSFLEAPFSMDGFGASHTSVSHHQSPHHPGSFDLTEAPLSPLTLSRLQASWNNTQDRQNPGSDDHQQQTQGATGFSPSNDQARNFSADFDADFPFFSSTPSHAGGKADLEESYLLGRNSLGLLDDTLLHLSPQTVNSSTAMYHSQSASGILDSTSRSSLHEAFNGSPRKAGHATDLFHRAGDDASPLSKPQRSLSVSSTSFLNSRNGSIDTMDHVSGVQDPSRHDFSIGQSPKSLINGPESKFRQSDVHHNSSTFNGQGNDNLLSLSQTQAGSMGPPVHRSNPAMNLAKRGMLDGIDSDKAASVEEGEPTPLASSMSTFAGQRHALGPIAPSTPFTTRQTSTPGSSASSTATPNDNIHNWFSSPFTPASAAGSDRPGMQRMHSIDGTSHGQHAALGMQAFTQPLEAFWSDKEALPANGQDRSGLGLSGSNGQDNVNGGLSLFHRRTQQNATSRVTSAPSLAPLSISTAAINSSVPSTPSDCPPGSAVSWASSIPSTPGDVTLSLSPAYGGVGMSHSRSMGGMPSNMSPINVSSLSLHDGSPYAGRNSFSEIGGSPTHGKTMNKGRSNSKSGGSTPRKTGGRASGAPPPLVVSSADKVHVCHCGKRFKRMEHLKRHNRTHTQERPHKCPVDGCGKYFGRTDNLAQHLKTHFRATGLARASQQLFAMSNSQGEHIDLRHDPHAAAAQAAAAAMQAVKGKRRSSTISHSGGVSDGSDILGGPISLTKQGYVSPHERNVLTASASANASPSGAYSLSPPYQDTM